jgi:2-methylcitrate dehydratase PrpD
MANYFSVDAGVATMSTLETEELGETLRLAKFCAELEYDDLDDDVVNSVEKAVVDALASGYAGIDTEAGRPIRRYVAGLGAEGSGTILGERVGALPHFAALANGTMMHALDVDDGHRVAAGHPGSAVVPAVLAVAEDVGASGADVVVAVAAGYEAMAKTAMSVQTSHRERGFHGTATTGCIGASAAVGRLYGLDTDEMADAIGLGGTQAGGLFEFLAQGSMSKRFHPGRAAMAGVLAGGLAAEGFDGPATIIEGEDGFARAFADEYDLSPFEDLGDPFEVTQNYLKPYPCCRHIHGPIEAVFAVRESGVAAEDVESVRVETYQAAAHHDNEDVENLLDAQMSIPYGVAIGFVEGDASLAEFEPPRTDDPEIRRLVSATEVVQTEEMEERYPETRPARVVVRTADGDEHVEVVEYPTGCAENPMSEAELREKFADLSADHLTDDERAAVLDAAFSLASVDDAASFTAHL